MGLHKWPVPVWFLLVHTFSSRGHANKRQISQQQQESPPLSIPATQMWIGSDSVGMSVPVLDEGGWK
jgi:hypothetical protein